MDEPSGRRRRSGSTGCCCLSSYAAGYYIPQDNASKTQESFTAGRLSSSSIIAWLFSIVFLLQFELGSKIDGNFFDKKGAFMQRSFSHMGIYR